MKTLTEIIDAIGAAKTAELCGVSVRAVYKWRKWVLYKSGGKIS